MLHSIFHRIGNSVSYTTKASGRMRIAHSFLFLEKCAELTHEKRQGKIEAYEFMKVEGMADLFSHAFDDY